MSAQTRTRKKKDTMQRRSWLLLLLFIPLIAGIIFSILPKPSPKMSGPAFIKQGELKFISKDGKRIISQIDIELAANDEKRTQGLMWRRKMEENQGMLFVMEQQEMQSFWMLNTYIPLDILFVDELRQIVTIRSNTKPQSLDPVASDKPALYVVEVNAGYCRKFGISVGDKIEF